MTKPAKIGQSVPGVWSPWLVLSLIASLLAQTAAAGDYWLIPRLWLAWTYLAGLLVVFALAIAVIAMAGAAVDLWRRRWSRGGWPIGVVALTFLALWLVPYNWINVLVDFHLLKHGKEAIVAEAQSDHLTFIGQEGDVQSYPLPPGSELLALGGAYFAAQTPCGRYVFLPTYFGVPDGAGGFLYVPPCARPEDFPGEIWGAKWFAISRVADNWYRIDGT